MLGEAAVLGLDHLAETGVERVQRGAEVINERDPVPWA